MMTLASCSTVPTWYLFYDSCPEFTGDLSYVDVNLLWSIVSEVLHLFCFPPFRMHHRGAGVGVQDSRCSGSTFTLKLLNKGTGSQDRIQKWIVLGLNRNLCFLWWDILIRRSISKKSKSRRGSYLDLKLTILVKIFEIYFVTLSL